MNVLVISFSSAPRDGRVLRQVDVLRRLGRVALCAMDAEQVPGVDPIPVVFEGRSFWEKVRALPSLMFGDPMNYYDGLKYVANARRLLEGRRFDLIVAND
ncbi:MAG: hypothetical protein D6743_05165, partial [Calditrichaeota bacterium]